MGHHNPVPVSLMMGKVAEGELKICLHKKTAGASTPSRPLSFLPSVRTACSQQRALVARPPLATAVRREKSQRPGLPDEPGVGAPGRRLSSQDHAPRAGKLAELPGCGAICCFCLLQMSGGTCWARRHPQKVNSG